MASKVQKKVAPNGVEVTFLRDTLHGGKRTQPEETATLLADFVDGAHTALHVAIYDFRLSEALGKKVVAAFKRAAKRGVEIRIAYDAGKPAAKTAKAVALAFAKLGADPAPRGTEQWLEQNLGGDSIDLRAIKAPGSKLMHSKYIVRDAGSAEAAVWMGSANFTDGAWTRQENNILRLASPALATAYETDFGELWRAGSVTSTGVNDIGDTPIGGVDIGWAFSPGEGPQIDAHLAGWIGAAKRRIRVSSMVLTSHTVLGALADAIERGIDLAGIYDGGQMSTIAKEWAKSSKSAAVAATFKKVSASLVAKPSSKFTPDGPHDFMHNKVLVSDDLVATGSYNFSLNAEGNAENQLSFDDPGLAQSYADYIDVLVKQYR